MSDIISVKTGDVVLVSLPNAIGHQQGGTRYAVVVSNNIGNLNSPTVEIIPATTKRNKSTLPTHAHFKAGEIVGLSQDTTFEAESKWIVNKYQIIKKVSRLSDPQLEKIAAAMLMATPMIIMAVNNNFHTTKEFKRVMRFV